MPCAHEGTRLNNSLRQEGSPRADVAFSQKRQTNRGRANRKAVFRNSSKTAIGLMILSLASSGWCADVISIWGGARGTVILKSDGTVWTWGSNIGGKLGI